ncbi:hypothetical protein [Pseudarthrobacter sulfonivorans]|uniref:hypothetical protein n=1 Tax=Pseudarthrobacter sulfonivorans TaxID=121292 RepID=UPI0012FE37F4|nr:hypothetical protein [Pseudarthrobacter sulfonivorans]
MTDTLATPGGGVVIPPMGNDDLILADFELYGVHEVPGPRAAGWKVPLTQDGNRADVPGG